MREVHRTLHDLSESYLVARSYTRGRGASSLQHWALLRSGAAGVWSMSGCDETEVGRLRMREVILFNARGGVQHARGTYNIQMHWVIHATGTQVVTHARV